MKYIDSEKLIAEIERLKKNLPLGGSAGQLAMECNCKNEAYNEVLSFIESLEKEQEGLHFTPLGRLIQKLPWNDSTNSYAKKLVDCLIREGYIKDAQIVQGIVSYKNGNNVPMATMDEVHIQFNDERMLKKEQFAGETMMEKDKIDTAFTRMLEKERKSNEGSKMVLNDATEKLWQSIPHRTHAIYDRIKAYGLFCYEQGRKHTTCLESQGLDEAAEKYKIGDRIRIKGSGAKGDIITNVYTSSEGRFYEFKNSDDQPINLNWELVKTDVEIAAEEYIKNHFTHYPDGTTDRGQRYLAFKAGVKFQAEQGYNREAEVKEDAGGYPYIDEIELYDYDNDKPLAKKGDKVVVQIRKK